MGKLMIWVVTIVGLTPALAIACSSLLLLFASRPQEGSPESTVLVHDSYVKIGSTRIDFTPEYWSAGLLLLGALMIVVGIAAILRPQ